MKINIIIIQYKIKKQSKLSTKKTVYRSNFLHGGVLANYQFKSHHCHTILFGSLKIVFLKAVLKMLLNVIKYWPRRLNALSFPGGSLVLELSVEKVTNIYCHSVIFPR